MFGDGEFGVLSVTWLGGGFKYVLFSSLFEEIIQFDEHNRLVQPPTRWLLLFPSAPNTLLEGV